MSSSSSDPPAWRCTTCGKPKDLAGPHLTVKKEVRSDCWPCARKRIFRFCLHEEWHNTTMQDATVPTTEAIHQGAPAPGPATALNKTAVSPFSAPTTAATTSNPFSAKTAPSSAAASSNPLSLATTSSLLSAANNASGTAMPNPFFAFLAKAAPSATAGVPSTAQPSATGSHSTKAPPPESSGTQPNPFGTHNPFAQAAAATGSHSTKAPPPASTDRLTTRSPPPTGPLTRPTPLPSTQSPQTVTSQPTAAAGKSAQPNPFSNITSTPPLNPLPAPSTRRVGSPHLGSTAAAGDDQWLCASCSKQKELNGPHLKGKNTVRSDCWPCGRKRIFIRHTDGVALAAFPVAMTIPIAATSSSSQAPFHSTTPRQSTTWSDTSRSFTWHQPSVAPAECEIQYFVGQAVSFIDGASFSEQLLRRIRHMTVIAKHHPLFRLDDSVCTIVIDGGHPPSSDVAATLAIVEMQLARPFRRVFCGDENSFAACVLYAAHAGGEGCEVFGPRLDPTVSHTSPSARAIKHFKGVEQDVTAGARENASKVLYERTSFLVLPRDAGSEALRIDSETHTERNRILDWTKPSEAGGSRGLDAVVITKRAVIAELPQFLAAARPQGH